MSRTSKKSELFTVKKKLEYVVEKSDFGKVRRIDHTHSNQTSLVSMIPYGVETLSYLIK